MATQRMDDKTSVLTLDNDGSCKFKESFELTRSHTNLDFGQATIKPTNSPIMSYKEDAFAFSGGQSTVGDDDELTESKIRTFLDEKYLYWSLHYHNYLEVSGKINVSHDPVLHIHPSDFFMVLVCKLLCCTWALILLYSQ